MANKKNKNRIVSFPMMGSIYIPVKAILEKMGAQVIVPPHNNKATLNLGVRNSLEGICLPYKLNLGNYIQALEKGANTLLMFQAPGTCRLGNYTKIASQTLTEMGYEFEMIIFDMYKDKLKGVFEKFSYAAGNDNFIKILKAFNLGFRKFYALDDIERKLLYLRPREIKKGSAENVYNKGLQEIDNAKTKKQLKKALKETLANFEDVEFNEKQYVPTIYLTGEFFIMLDPYSNMEIEKELGNLGVEVQRQIMFSDWLEHVLKPGLLYQKESHRKRAMKYAKKFITRAVGGECLESIGDAVYAARNNADGLIHISPFNCTPEVIAQNILSKVSEEEDIPVLSLVFDECTAKAGFITRLEAFVDLVKRKKFKKETLCN